jgi:hypothetical protein
MALSTKDCSHLKITSFNMHGFNQDYSHQRTNWELSSTYLFTTRTLAYSCQRTQKFNVFSDYFTFVCSAMNICVDSEMLVGRPFGGVFAMMNYSLRNLARTVYCSDRCPRWKLHDCQRLLTVFRLTWQITFVTRHIYWAVDTMWTLCKPWKA